MARKNLYLYTVILLAFTCSIAGCYNEQYGRLNVPQPNDKSHFTFIVYGDSRQNRKQKEYDKIVRAHIARQIRAENPAFVIHTGDMVRKGTSKEQWKQFNEVFKDPLEAHGILHYPAIGNHDVEYGPWNFLPTLWRKPYVYLNLAVLPAVAGGIMEGLGSLGLMNNADDALQKNYFVSFPHVTDAQGNFLTGYSFSYGNAFFISLDTEHNCSKGSKQYLFFDSELKKAGAKTNRSIEASPTAPYHFLFVYFHRPPYTVFKHSPYTEQLKDVLQRLRTFKKRHSDTEIIVFSGHTHSYERYRDADGIYYIVSGGGGANPHVKRARPFKKIKDQGITVCYVKDGTNYHYCKIEIHGTNLKFQMMRLNTATWGAEKEWAFHLEDNFSLPSR